MNEDEELYYSRDCSGKFWFGMFLFILIAYSLFMSYEWRKYKTMKVKVETYNSSLKLADNTIEMQNVIIHDQSNIILIQQRKLDDLRQQLILSK